MGPANERTHPLSVPRSDASAILRLAVPSMLALLTQTLVNTVDTYFFGLLPEPDRSDGQAMLSLALPLLWAIGGFFSAISVGTQAIVARRFGAGDKRATSGVLSSAVALSIVVSLAASVVGWFVVPYAFELASNDPDYIRIGTEYTQWRFVGVVSMVLTSAYKAFFDGTGRTHVHLVAAIFMNVANVILCRLLIFGDFGFPAMGAAGAGVAAAGSSWVGLAVMVAYGLRERDRAEFGVVRMASVSASVVRDLARLSVPSGVATTVVMTGFILFRQIVQALDSGHTAAGGSESIYGAATTIIMQILSISLFGCLAFGVATATLVSQNLGRGDGEAAERLGWNSTKLGMLIFGGFGLLQALFPEQCIALFNDSPAVIAAGAPSMRLMGACGPLVAAGLILTQALFGAGNTRFVMIVELGLHFGCLVPLAWVFGVWLEWGLFGVWLSAAVYAAMLAGAMAIEFRRGRWKQIRI